MKFIEGFKNVFNSTQLGEMVAILILIALATTAISVFTAWGIKRVGLE